MDGLDASDDAPMDGPIPAAVIARWDAERVMLQTDAGRIYDVSVPDAVAAQIDVGDRACLVLDDAGALARWWPERAPDVATDVEPRQPPTR